MELILILWDSTPESSHVDLALVSVYLPLLGVPSAGEAAFDPPGPKKNPSGMRIVR